MMIGRQSSASACRLALCIATIAALQANGAAAEPVDLRASYAITLSIFTIGKVDVVGHFTDAGYSASIKGSTSGLGRLVSDSRAELTGAGTIAGARVLPSAYSLRTAEGDFTTRVDMSMRGGTLAKVDVDPTLLDAPDRVPLTDDTLRRFLDPVGALIVARDSSGPADGKEICNRTVAVFDGWVRYDIPLAYKETTNFSGRSPSYSGPAIVCTARYIPVAGHRQSRESVQYMAQNQRLEAWLAPVKGTNLMIPVKFIIGTTLGDLSVTARDFTVSTPQRQATAAAPTPATK
jgi:hypothetical protein